MGEPEKGRIAIKFGTSSASASVSSSARPSPRPRAAPPSSLGKRPRAHALGGASDSDSDGDDRHRGRHEVITGFGAHGAETERERSAREAAKKEFVIARQPNRDWRAEMKAQRSSRRPLPGQEGRRKQSGNQRVETEPADQDKEIKWGLTVKEKKKASDDADEARQEGGDAPGTQPQQGDETQKEPTPERTLDDEAMDALLGRTTKTSKTIIHPAPLTEDDAYRRDAEAAGAASTLEDYEAMPVEEFGAALLRGMGWKGEERAPKPKEVRRRANRLGLGAKELKEDEDLGGWNQGGVQKKKKRPRLDEYRREESRRKEGRRNHEDSYKREREREREGHRDDNNNNRDRQRDYDRHRDRDAHHHHRSRDYDRDRRR
ncbi:DNA primase large subunit Spp2 [Purpureocillium takamizusanense]|uniref:Pre-mRNA-splicing factor n=1 Tax=Purpureocillium takamizusanense TaxID=2060973 RepID=A0A9Q8QKI1_9HYPO|nr:DNA primase large subunit Spp2 [Purpureocillium takamizusanense]UNI21428.1 DNA primase large subunit Spp2 [Purpureocillium takamizusanense]